MTSPYILIIKSIKFNIKRNIMKTKIMTMFIVALMTVTLSAQGETRSYFCQQINAPVSTGPTATVNQATFVEWDDDDNTIRMMDGTVCAIRE